ncbi:uncharacterized protein H6S33_012049 [Morchella sextelata]|uniref:uncharacterized protein n=1 Tax=Morchella sextelata TaxID=1174677 RepID=UPI001D058BF7|nr:uncharacterized protein H6S33_012049 [Morchella sextelata]KAH0610522.1 hypothetical protein H6S33_012049 [Morchella sextelata]
MSTPSTASALPPLNFNNTYDYNHHRHPHQHQHPHHILPVRHAPLPSPLQYQPPVAPASTTATANSATPTSSVSASSDCSSTLSAMASRSQPASRKNPKRPVDWDEYFKNGPPKEIIVIDDSPPPQPAPSGGSRQQPSTVSRTAHMTGHYNLPNGSGGQILHTDKKRKTTQYDTGYPDHHSYSSTQTPHAYGSPTTLSTHSSTVSINGNSSTAATSLGSTGIGTAGPSYAPQAAAAATAGPKRKRVTRASHAAAANTNLDAFASYHPPPKPPIKAKDVYVMQVQDNDRNLGVRVDDDDGHYIITPDTDLTTRYHITKLLGQGTFGKVVEAYDRVKRTKCAIKVIRSVQKYRDASRIELRVLSTLACNDKDNKNKCIHLRDCFDYRNHICIVTDLLGMSVFDFLKANTFAPFPNSHIQSFARQLLTSVAFLHDLNLIHTDLKPENILLVHNSFINYAYNRPIPSSSTTTQRQGRSRRVLLDTDIRLIDFGSATFDDEYHSSVVSTRHYRAPEIILGLGWSFPCDLWSIGCILVEFYTGDALFQTHDNLEHLAMMQAVCAQKIDTRLVRSVLGRNGNSNHSSTLIGKYFKGARLDYPNTETTRASKKYVNAMKSLPDIIPPNTRFNKQFLDLLKRIFVYDPSKRITAKEALKHDWFKEPCSDEGTEAAKPRDDKLAEKAAAQAQAQAQRELDGY